MFDQLLVPTLKPGDVVILDRSRLPQGKGGADGDPGCRSPPGLPAEILPPTSTPIEQVFAKFKNSAAKGGSAKLRGDLRRLRQNPRPVPARRMRSAFLPQERRSHA